MFLGDFWGNNFIFGKFLEKYLKYIKVRFAYEKKRFQRKM